MLPVYAAEAGDGEVLKLQTKQLAKATPRRQFCPMTTTVDAIYENGKLILPRPLSLPEKSPVRVTIESDVEREAWLKLSEESLAKVWDNDANDVFNQLAAMANDPQIQRELRSINAEFAAAESDGLGKI
jgi:predicted DNA-binding antitoxin AbrB/MazE fold protein